VPSLVPGAPAARSPASHLLLTCPFDSKGFSIDAEVRHQESITMKCPHVSARIGLATALLVVAGTPPAVASCGSASCFLVTHAEEGVEEAGSFQVSMSYQYVDQTKKLRGSSSTDEVLVPAIDFADQVIEPDHHLEISTRNTMLLMNLAYGVTARLSVFGNFPLVVSKAHEHYDDVGTPDEFFTNNDGTAGVGDVLLGARYALLVKANDLLLGTASIKLPTGPYKLLDTDGAINEPTIQPGTGSYDGVISLYYAKHLFPSSFEWFVSASQRFNGRNSLEYQIGNETVVSGGFNYAHGERWVYSLQLNARHAGRDDYLGQGVPSTGSDAVTLSPGIRFGPGKGLELYGYVQIPVYQDVNEAQLAPRFGAVVGFTKRF
jgi:hypothetical protein